MGLELLAKARLVSIETYWWVSASSAARRAPLRGRCRSTQVMRLATGSAGRAARLVLCVQAGPAAVVQNGAEPAVLRGVGPRSGCPCCGDVTVATAEQFGLSRPRRLLQATGKRGPTALAGRHGGAGGR